MRVCKCYNCGLIFDEPVIAYDHEEAWGYPCLRPYPVCPRCHEPDDWDEIEDDEVIEDAV